MSTAAKRHCVVATVMLATALMLAACGTTPAERGVSGGLLGAGAGAAIGSLSGNAGAGAVIGGVAGGAAGLLTTPPPPRCVQVSSSGRCLAWR